MDLTERIGSALIGLALVGTTVLFYGLAWAVSTWAYGQGFWPIGAAIRLFLLAGLLAMAMMVFGLLLGGSQIGASWLFRQIRGR